MPTQTWHQYNVIFGDHSTATETAARELLPGLIQAQQNGLVHEWWFIRKQPWKLRYRPEDEATMVVAELLEHQHAKGNVTGWVGEVYEPEMRAFGGEEGMRLAHRHFHHDSHHLLLRAAQPTLPRLGQRETTVLLCSAMLRAAGLDWYEQGDVWAKVAELRPFELNAIPAQRAPELAQAMRTLMTAEVSALSGPQAPHREWTMAFTAAGKAMAELARSGRLSRGLRAVLAHLIIFHTNRAGLALPDQSSMAELATRAVFAGDDTTFTTTSTTTTTRGNVTTTDHRSSKQMRNELTDHLKGKVIHSTAVEDAFRQVPRDVFLPGVSLEAAYANTPVYIKEDPVSGAKISAASEPWTVAAMLEQLDAQPGDRLLEAGAGTGYNAALMGAIVGETGHVTTIDVDEDLVTGARTHLDAAGANNVEVVLGDGALGYDKNAPYQRMIATVGAYEVPTAWLEQLAPDGRLVVPLRLRGTNSRSIVFERNDNGSGWRSVDSRLAVFMPLRGIGDDARRIVTLTPHNDVTLQVHKDQDVDGQALTGVLDAEAYTQWSGVLFPAEVPYEWVDLWLCLRLDNALMRMNVERSVAERDLVRPMFPWGSMATTQGGNLAYLTTRPVPQPDGGKLYEIGVVGHGPSVQELVHRVVEELRTWEDKYRHKTVRFEIADGPVGAEPQAEGRFVLDRPHHPITVIWD